MTNIDKGPSLDHFTFMQIPNKTDQKETEIKISKSHEFMNTFYPN